LIKETEPEKQYSEFAKYSFYNYIAVFIGVFSNLFIYTTNEEFLGVLRYTESLAFLIWPLILMGASSSLINFTPKLKQKSNVKLFSYSLFTVIRNSILIFLIIFLGVDLLSDFVKFEFIYFAFFLGLLLAAIDLIKKQLTIYQKIAFPSILDNLFPKLVLPGIFILLYYKFIEANSSGLRLYVISYLFILTALFFYAFKRKSIAFTIRIKSVFTNFSKKEYRNYSFFALAGSLGYMFVFKLDSLMIPNLISYKANGVYSISAVAASVIFIPARGLFSLYAPQVSKMITDGHFESLNKLYKDVAKMLLFLGLLIYSAIFLGIENLFQLMPSKDLLMQTVSVIFIIGATSVFNMATGFNSEIINYSKFYKFNIIALGVLTILNLFTNYYFIVIFDLGIQGAALASFLSIVFFNLLKVGFIYFRLGLFPFEINFFKLLILQICLILVFYFIPNFSSPLSNFLFKVSGVLSSQLFFIYRFKWLSPLNTFIDKYFFSK
jgi:O-antigen/teichoic acid export membrane protein